MSTSIVSAEWLLQHLNDPHIAIADCRFSLADPTMGRRQYQESHILGAHYFDLNLDLSSPVQQHGGRHPLPDPDRLAAKLASAGVWSANGHEPTLVVAYDDSRFGFAARLWWLLRYLGHDRVAVLDGGWRAWLAAGYPVTAATPAVQSGQFVPQVRSDWVVNVEAVKASQDDPHAVLIDSREAERYRGEREPIDPVAGHIPGAVNYPWQGVTDAEGYALPIADQQARWQAIAPGRDVIVYCGSGVTACVNLLALALVGVPAKLYAGSWSDWCSYPENVCFRF